MRWGLVLAGASIAALAWVSWLWISSSDESQLFVSVHAQQVRDPATGRVPTQPIALQPASLPVPADATGASGQVQASASGEAKRLRDPVELARALLLDAADRTGRRIPSRAQRVDELRRELTALRSGLENAAGDPSDELLSQVRSRFDQARIAAGRVFPEQSPSAASSHKGAPAPFVNPVMDRRYQVRTPRPAPPGVLDRIRDQAPVAIPSPPRTQLVALLDRVESVLSGARPDPASLERAARGIDAALEKSDTGHGPAIRYSTARFKESGQ